jgi:Cu(I)/Ag(I) efflux system membrane fusion protein
VAAVLLVAAGMAAGVWWAQRAPHAETATASSAKPEPKVLYWHDPMVPGAKFDKPGKSPFMDMQLVPVYADEEGAAASGVKVESRLVQNLGVRTAVAEKGTLERSLEAVGAIAFDERAVVVVQSRTAGYVEQLFVRAPLDAVRKGQPLARLFVPEWAGAQQEYLALRMSSAPGAEDLAKAARNRLLLLGMTESQVLAVDKEGQPQPRVTLASPVDGVVGELAAREGMTVMAGAMLFRINGLGTVWVNLDVPEAQAAVVKPGALIVASVPAYPGETFKGQVAAVLPDVAKDTRTLRARVELANPGGRLKPGMFATVAVASKSREAVLVPSEAVIVTGERSLVVVDRGEGRFEPVAVKIGAEQGGRTEVLSGIEPGTKVVASGQFLIDSEASLRGIERRMEPAAAANAGANHAEGVLEAASGNMLTISHGPVPALQWPPMTMEFNAPKGGLPAGVKVGDRIAFDFVQSAGGWDVTKVEKRP